MNKVAHDIILRPVNTEESMKNVNLEITTGPRAGQIIRKYTFKVDKKANKAEIKAAVEEVFGVKVVKVNTMNCKGHLRRYGRYEGYTPSWKKAIVTISEDSKPIEFFDGLL